MSYYCISALRVTVDDSELEQTVGTQDEIETLAWSYAEKAREGVTIAVNIFVLVPEPPSVCGYHHVTFKWQQVREYDDIGKIFTVGFEAVREAAACAAFPF